MKRTVFVFAVMASSAAIAQVNPVPVAVPTDAPTVSDRQREINDFVAARRQDRIDWKDPAKRALKIEKDKADFDARNGKIKSK